MFLTRADTLRGQVGGGWPLEIESFWAPNGTHLTARCHFTGPKKLSISMAQPPPIIIGAYIVNIQIIQQFKILGHNYSYLCTNQTHECNMSARSYISFLDFSCSNSPIYIHLSITVFIGHGKQFSISQCGMTETFAYLGEFEEKQLNQCNEKSCQPCA
jgi:hypothetical protein